MPKNNVKVKRWKAGIRQYELAQKIKIPPPVLSEIENGIRDPSEEQKVKLAKSLGCSMRELFPRV